MKSVYNVILDTQLRDLNSQIPTSIKRYLTFLIASNQRLLMLFVRYFFKITVCI